MEALMGDNHTFNIGDTVRVLSSRVPRDERDVTFTVRSCGGGECVIDNGHPDNPDPETNGHYIVARVPAHGLDPWEGDPRLTVSASHSVVIARLTRERDDLRDIVTRTARALGIPEVDEDGAMPSLHDVPERVGRLVAEVERLRPVERTPLERIARAKWAYRYERFDGDRRRVCYLSAEPLWAKITPRTDNSWKDCDWEIGGFGSTRSGFCAAGEYAAQRAVRKAFRDALADNEPTDNDATQDPPGWGGGEVSDGE